jgi:hypothetical protein
MLYPPLPFSDDDLEEEEKEVLSNKLVASLKQKNHCFRGASHRVAPSGL